MSKSARLSPVGDPELDRVAELSIDKALRDQLARIIAELDKAKQPVSAAYAQMALDVLRH